MTASPDDPTIDDLLGDPMTQAVMQADGVDPAELEALLRALAARLAGPADRSNDDALDEDALDSDAVDAERMPFERNAVGRFLLSISPGRGEASRLLAARPSTRPRLCGVS